MKLRKIALVSAFTVAAVVALTQAAPTIWTFARRGVQDFRHGAGTQATFTRPNMSGGVDTLSAISPIPVTAYGVRGTGTYRDADSLAVACAAVDAMGGGDLYFPKPATSYGLTKTDLSTVTITNANTRAIGFVPPLLAGGAPRDIWGSGSPEGAYVAPVGSVYRSTLSGAGDIYVKKTGASSAGWVLVSGSGETGTTGDIAAPILSGMSGSVYCSSAVSGITIFATTNERARLVLEYRRNSGTWTDVNTSSAPFASPELYAYFTTNIGCVISDVYNVRIAAVDSVGNASAWLDTLVIQYPQDETLVDMNISVDSAADSSGTLIATVTGTVSRGPVYLRRWFGGHEDPFNDAAMEAMSWSTSTFNSISDELNTGITTPTASDDSTISLVWENGTGPIEFTRLEYRRPPDTAWSVLDSNIIYPEVEDYWWNLASPTAPRRGPVEFRICSVDSSGNLSAYSYLIGGTYYNQSELVTAHYEATTDTTAGASMRAIDAAELVFYAASPDTTPTAAPQITSFTILSTDSLASIVRAHVSGIVSAYGATAHIKYKWGYDGTWSDSTDVALGSSDGTKNIDYQYVTEDSTANVLPDTLWVAAAATGVDSMGSWVRDDIYVERTPAPGDVEFNYLFELSAGDSNSYGYPGRTLIDVSDGDEYWMVRGGADSLLTSTLATDASYVNLRAYGTGPDVSSTRRGRAVCFHWPVLADTLAGYSNIDSFRIHFYLAGIQTLEFSAEDSLAVGFITNVDMQEPVDGTSDNTSGAFVNVPGATRWAVSPLYDAGNSRPEGWGPGAWEFETIADSIPLTHIEFDISPSKVEAAIDSGTWDGTFVIWVCATSSAHYFYPYLVATGDKWRRPSIIVRGTR